MRWLKSQQGFGLIEVLVSMALLGVGIYTIMEGLDYIERQKSHSNKEVAFEALLSSIVESVRSNIIMEKVDFQASQNWLNNSTTDAVKNSLKLCWMNEGISPIETMPTCPGRIGYVVTPSKIGNLELRGLYQVTIRVTHDVQFPGTFKEFNFLVRGP